MNAAGDFEHEGDNESIDLVLGFQDGKVITGGGEAVGAKVILEVDGGSKADLLVDEVSNDEVEDSEGKAMQGGEEEEGNRRMAPAIDNNFCGS